MIDYKLAKELKDAGFPQNGELSDAYFDSEGGVQAVSMHLADDCLRIPTLSELIEACGDDFSGICKEDKWIAASNGGIYDMITANGDTPVEAVANLYLKLNDRRTSN